MSELKFEHVDVLGALCAELKDQGADILTGSIQTKHPDIKVATVEAVWNSGYGSGPIVLDVLKLERAVREAYDDDA